MADTDSAEAAREDTGEHWAMLIDPNYEPAHPDDPVPEEAIVGAWYVDDGGIAERFAPNHAYRPSSPDLPTDPLDARLRLAARGEATADEFVASLPGALVCLALDEDGSAIVTRAPDGVPSVLVLTSLAHAHRLTVESWQEMEVERLVALLPVAGVDVLFNPGGEASVRLGADELRHALADEQSEPAEPAGAAGPAGPAGAAGPAGPAGRAGPAGPAGTAGSAEPGTAGS